MYKFDREAYDRRMARKWNRNDHPSALLFSNEKSPRGFAPSGPLFHDISISRFAMEIFADFGHLPCPPTLFHALRIAHIARNIFYKFGHHGFPNSNTVR